MQAALSTSVPSAELEVWKEEAARLEAQMAWGGKGRMPLVYTTDTTTPSLAVTTPYLIIEQLLLLFKSFSYSQCF